MERVKGRAMLVYVLGEWVNGWVWRVGGCVTIRVLVGCIGGWWVGRQVGGCGDFLAKLDCWVARKIHV